jgi:hypothetical protein
VKKYNQKWIVDDISLRILGFSGNLFKPEQNFWGIKGVLQASAKVSLANQDELQGNNN